MKYVCVDDILCKTNRVFEVIEVSKTFQVFSHKIPNSLWAFI